MFFQVSEDYNFIFTLFHCIVFAAEVKTLQLHCYWSSDTVGVNYLTLKLDLSLHHVLMVDVIGCDR